MEILEKLPGITVERHLLLNGSYTSAGPNKMTTASAQRQRFQRQPTRNRSLLTRSRRTFVLDETNQGRVNRHTEIRPVNRSFTVSQYHKFTEKPEMKLELEVLGKNPHQNSSTLSYSTKEATVSKQVNSGSPNQQNAPPVLKSILKRTGSGVSSRSCTLLEVMSLDSGMCRLAASLAAHKTTKGSGNTKSTKANAKAMAVKERTIESDEISAPGNAMEVSHADRKTPHLPEEPAITSPTKSVSFRLDPEMQIREKERSLLSNRKGDARWGVVISSYQTRNKEKTKPNRRSDFSSSRKREIKSNASLYLTQEKQHESSSSSEEIQGLNEKVNGNSLSIALLRHHVMKGKPSMSDIHHLSESYRKFLMNRALEQTPQVSKDANQSNKNAVTLKSFLAEAASAGLPQTESSKKLKTSGLDKHYMTIANAPCTVKTSPFLPDVRSQN